MGNRKKCCNEYSNRVDPEPLQHYIRYHRRSQLYSRFHVSLDNIISPPQDRAQLGAADDNGTLLTTVKPRTIRLLSVHDDLSFYISQLQIFETPSALTWSRGLP